MLIPKPQSNGAFFIFQITAGGAAHRTSKLRMGDRILMVNGVDMNGATHQEAVMALLNPPNEITLTVRHDPQPKGLKVGVYVCVSLYSQIKI